MDPTELQARAYDVYILLRSLPAAQRATILSGTPADIAVMYRGDPYISRKFPIGEFPAELAVEARNHDDYPQYDKEGQLRFVARYVCGAGVSSPEYSLKVTRTIFSDKKRTR